MPPAFDITTPVVDFGATSAPLRWSSNRWLLWPAYACKVMLPGRDNPPFNVIQRALLDLCRAGVRDAGEIARRLALPPDLVNFVLDQLAADIGLLDNTYEPTPRALQLLDESDHPTVVEDAGYVFVDGHSQRLWPRVHRGSLPYVDAEEKKGQLTFQRGSQGRQKPVHATILWPDRGVHLGMPHAHDVQRAARLHSRRLRAYRREVSRQIVSDDVLDGLKGRGLRLLGTEPEPVFVAVCVFQPEDAQHRSWLVTDPCGLGVSDVLRSGIISIARKGRHRHITKLLEEMAGQAWAVDQDDLAIYFAEATTAATERVSQHLGGAAELLPPGVLQRLADADMRLDGVPTAKQIDDFYGNAYAALEDVFGWLVSLYPDSTLLAALQEDAPSNVALLQQIAEQIGFTVSPETQPIFRVTRNVVKGAIEYANKTLPGRLAAALLAALHTTSHPLSMLAMRDPLALAFLVELGRHRIDASHATSGIPDVGPAMVMRDRLFSFLRDLVGVLPPVTVTGGMAPVWGTDLLLRIRVRAEKTAEACPGLEEHPDLRARVIEMHDASLLVKLLADSSSVISEQTLKTRRRDAVVATTIAMETLFTKIGRNVHTPASVMQMVTYDRERNATQIALAASSLGFALDAAGQLPKALTHAKANRIRRAAQGEGETLSAQVAAQLLTASQKPEHPLHEVAGRLPQLLLDVGRLVDARGHGDDVSASVADVAELETMVASTVRTVIEIID